MSNRKSQAFSDLITGVFMLSVLVLLAYFTIIISGVDVLRGRERAMMTVAFDQVGGLKAHDSVLYRGTKVGTVDRIELSERGLKVFLDVDRSVVLREGYDVTVRSLSMLGGNYLMLEEGEGEVIDFTARELRGESPSDMMRDVAKIAKNLNDLTSMAELREMLTSIREMSRKVDEIVSRVERGEGTLGKLVSSEDTVYEDLKAAVADAKEAAASAKASLAEAKASVDDVRRTFANAAEITDELRAGDMVADLKAAIASFRRACDSFDMSETKGDVGEITAGAKKLVASLTGLAEKIERGEGTLGKLMRDDGAYEEVNGLLRDARQILDNYRDTTPISTFSSLATGAL